MQRFRLMVASDWNRLVKYVKTLPFERDGKQVMYQISVAEMKSKRSPQQNARYWALLNEISRIAPSFMGDEWHSPEVWHEYCKRRFLGVDPGPFGGGVPRTTTKLKVGEFADYMTQVEAWAVDQFPGFNFEYQEAA